MNGMFYVQIQAVELDWSNSRWPHPRSSTPVGGTARPGRLQCSWTLASGVTLREGPLAAPPQPRCQAASSRPRWGEETGSTPAKHPQPHDSTCPCALAPARSGPWGNKAAGIESLTHWTVPSWSIMMGTGGGGNHCMLISCVLFGV